MDTAVPEYILDSVRSLPPLPAAVQKLISLAKDAEADFNEIARVIETDQTLTARTLRAANSALYGVSRRIQTVRQATVLLGRETVLSLAVGASVLSLDGQMKRTWPLDPTDFWRHGIAVASLAQALAKQMRHAEPGEAFVAGLLHDIGKLIMLDHFGDLYGQVLMAAQYGTKPLHQLERDVFDTDHAVVGHGLCLHWNIPPSLTRAVAEHHAAVEPAPGSTADVVRNANDLIKMMAIGSSGNQFAELRPSQFLPHNRIPRPVLAELLMDLPAEVRRAEALLGRGAQEEEPTTEAPEQAIHLQVQQAEEHEMLNFVLRGRGLVPVTLAGTAAEVLPPPDARPVALVTDYAVTPARRAAYAKHGIPVLDYGAWRQQAAPAPDGSFFNVHRLRGWLDEQLAAPPAEAEAA